MSQVPSMQIIELVADRNGVDPAELQPRLNDVIDPEALDRLFSPLNDGRERGSGSISFEYCGHQVDVTSAGEVHVSDLDAATSPNSTVD